MLLIPMLRPNRLDGTGPHTFIPLSFAVFMPVIRVRPVWMYMYSCSMFVQVAMVQTGWHLWVDVIVMSVVVSMPVFMYGSFVLMRMRVLFEEQEPQGNNDNQRSHYLSQ